VATTATTKRGWCRFGTTPVFYVSLLGDRRQPLARGQHLVDQAVHLRFGTAQDVVAVDVLVDLLLRAVGVLGDGLFQPFTHAKDLACLNLDVRRLPATGVTR